MNKSNLLTLFLAVGAIGGAGLAWRQHAELVELRAAAVDRAERAKWQRRVSELERLNREQQQQLTASRAAAAGELAGSPRARHDADTKPAAPAGVDTTAETAGTIRQQTAAIRELMDRPEVQAMLAMQKKAAVEQRYAGLWKKLNLTPSQIEKLNLLLTERANTMQDVLTAARDQGINPRENAEAFKKLIADVQGQTNANIKAAIGEDGFAQLTQYERTIPQRNVVSDLEQRLGFSNAPLTPAQAEQLVQILAANPPPRPVAQDSAIASGTASRTGGAAGKRPDAGAVVRNAMTTVPGVGLLLGSTDDGRAPVPTYPISQSALSQAQTILTAPQFAALQQLQQQQQTQQRLKQLTAEALLATQPTPSPQKPPSPRRPGGG